MALLVDAGHRQAVLYGEVFGRGVQSYDYGERSLAFRAFDLMLDGENVDRTTFASWCERVDLPTVPVLYEGPFSLDAIRAISDGDSAIGGTHGREGVVVRPIQERHDPTIGRAILKYVGDRYLFGLKQDFTDQ